jgi:hypothetical protein
MPVTTGGDYASPRIVAFFQILEPMLQSLFKSV